MKGKQALALAILPFVGALSADPASHVAYGNDNDSRQNRVAVKPAPGADVHGHDQFEQDNTYGMSLYGDYLYLKPYVSQLPWAQSSQGLASTAENGWAGYQTLNQVNFALHGDSGFRIGVAYESDWNTLGFTVDWTSFHSTQKNKREGTDKNRNVPGSSTGSQVASNRILPFWGDNLLVATDNGSIVDARAQYEMKYDFVDYAATSVVKPTSFLTLKPSLGLRTFYSTNNLRSEFKYNEWNDDLRAEGQVNTYIIRSTQKFNGLGPLFSSRALFEITEGFNFVTQCGFSYVVGQNRSEYNGNMWLAGNSVQERVKDYLTTFNTLYDLQVGLQYEWMTDERDFGLTFEIAYEAHFFPNFISYVDHNLGRGGVGTGSRATQLNPTITNIITDFAMQGLHLRGGMSF